MAKLYLKNKKNLFILLSVLIFIILAMFFLKSELRYKLTQYDVIQKMIPIYHSLRKIPDILFIPYTLFVKSELETFELVINPKNIEKMNSYLPKNPFGSDTLGDENKLWVPARFRADNYESNVKVRYRGNLANHWNSYKKSYLIKFPKDNLFRGMRKLVLIIPADRLYFAMSLNNYRSKKLGLLYPSEFFARVSLNGSPYGTYLALEHWSQEWIEKKPVSSLSKLYGVGESNNTGNRVEVFSYEGLPYWDSWNSVDPIDKDPIKTLLYLTLNTTDDDFKKIIPLILNMDAFLKREVLNALALSNHNNLKGSPGTNNAILLFNNTEGRFEPVPYNTFLYSFSEKTINDYKNTLSLLQKRLFSFPEFKEKRNNMIREYIIKNKQDDIDYLNNWTNKMNKEFYADHTKLYNNFMYLNKVNISKNNAIENMDKLSFIYDQKYEFNFSQDERIKLPASFKNLQMAIITPKEFVKNNPSFYLKDNEINLFAGNYYFKETIIVPVGTKLIIHPGAKIYMGEKSSIISYSPVLANGNKSQPIKINAIRKNKPWGVFAVVNTKKDSIFKYVNFSGGSEDVANAIYFSGMLAMHNANGIIKNSKFSYNYGDDGLNIKEGDVTVENSLFENMYSDGIDLDFPNKNTFIKNNTFKNIGGDAIDLSWSNIVLSNNTIDTCGDKGVSVGERSQVIMKNNFIKNCVIGVASKDQSSVIISSGSLINNLTAISAYKKKEVFGGAVINISNNVSLIGNNATSSSDNLSSVIFQ